jgi:hypothetical protein
LYLVSCTNKDLRSGTHDPGIGFVPLWISVVAAAAALSTFELGAAAVQRRLNSCSNLLEPGLERRRTKRASLQDRLVGKFSVRRQTAAIYLGPFLLPLPPSRYTGGSALWFQFAAPADSNGIYSVQINHQYSV